MYKDLLGLDLNKIPQSKKATIRKVEAFGSETSKSQEKYKVSAKYSEGNISPLNSNTPIIGNAVGALNSLGDKWKSFKGDKQRFFKGLSEFGTNPSNAYFLAKQAMWYTRGGKIKASPHINDSTETGKLKAWGADVLNKLGVNEVLDTFGKSSLGVGKPFTNRKYDTKHEYSHLDNSERTNESKGRTTLAYDSTTVTPLFALTEDEFITPFSANGVDYELLEELKGKDHDYDFTNVSDSDARVILERNYQNIRTPYSSEEVFKSSSPMDSLMYSLQKINSVTGYQDLAGFSPRTDQWKIILKPYVSSKGTVTPELPKTYIPYWTVINTGGNKAKYVCNLREFDWSTNLPAISYSFTMGNIRNSSIDFGQGSSFSVPESWSFNMTLQLGVIDDVDATFSKYMHYYLHSIMDLETNSRASIEKSCFEIDLIILKPALNINYEYKLIGIPSQVETDISGTAEGNDDNGTYSMLFDILGIIDGPQGDRAHGGETKNTIDRYSWNQVRIVL